MNWIKNEGKVWTPPTDKLVDIRVSVPNESHPDGVWLRQDPHRWDWLSQSCMIIEWKLSS